MLGGKWGVTASGRGVSFGGDETILKLVVLLVTQLSEYNRNH